MKHLSARKRLSRDSDHRKALVRNLSVELIDHEKIKTTLAKAKYIRPYFERLITKALEAAKTEDKVRKFNVLKTLRTKIHSETAIKKLLEKISPEYKGRKGGYLRITQIPGRSGDNAPMAKVELVK